MKGKIAIPNLFGWEVVDTIDIVRMQANGNYTTVFLRSGKSLISSQTLKYYTGQLRDEDFCRTHKSHLVNMAHVSRYVKGQKGMVEMTDSSKVPVSRTAKRDFLKNLAVEKQVSTQA